MLVFSSLVLWWASLSGTLISPLLIYANEVAPSYNKLETCSAGLKDCTFLDPTGEGECAAYSTALPNPNTMTWSLVVSLFFALLMAYGIGANDAANSWATSVGSGAISLKRAVIIGGFLEFMGAICLGYGVSKKIQKGVAKMNVPNCWACGFCDSKMAIYQGGMMSALVGASLFLMAASKTSVPVSTTHSIVGGVVGMTIAGTAASCLNWSIKGLGGIVLSWVISPVLSGLCAATLWKLSQRFVMNSREPVERAFHVVSGLFGLSTTVGMLVVFFKATPLKKLGFKKEKKHLAILYSSLVGAVVIGLVQTFLIPKLRQMLPSRTKDNLTASIENGMVKEDANEAGAKPSKGVKAVELTKKPLTGTLQKVNSVESISMEKEVAVDQADADELNKQPVTATAPQQLIVTVETEQEQNISKVVHVEGEIITINYESGPKLTIGQEDAVWVFRYLLIFNACIESFAHGSNDTANATGAFSAVWHTYTKGKDSCDLETTPWWIMGIAGLFVWLGIVTYGKNVIMTIGTRVTEIDFHKGFYIEFGSNFSVIIATLLEMPVSTTHCQIGGVLFVGLASAGTKGVDWPLLGLIATTWVVTLPAAGGIAALLTAIVRYTL